LGQAVRQKDHLPFELNPAGSSGFFGILNFMILFNLLQKNRAEHRTTGTKEAQNLLSKTG